MASRGGSASSFAGGGTGVASGARGSVGSVRVGGGAEFGRSTILPASAFRKTSYSTQEGPVKSRASFKIESGIYTISPNNPVTISGKAKQIPGYAKPLNFSSLRPVESITPKLPPKASESISASPFAQAQIRRSFGEVHRVGISPNPDRQLPPQELGKSTRVRVLGPMEGIFALPNIESEEEKKRKKRLLLIAERPNPARKTSPEHQTAEEKKQAPKIAELAPSKGRQRIAGYLKIAEAGSPLVEVSPQTQTGLDRRLDQRRKNRLQKGLALILSEKNANTNQAQEAARPRSEGINKTRLKTLWIRLESLKKQLKQKVVKESKTAKKSQPKKAEEVYWMGLDKPTDRSFKGDAYFLAREWFAGDRAERPGKFIAEKLRPGFYVSEVLRRIKGDRAADPSSAARITRISQSGSETFEGITSEIFQDKEDRPVAIQKGVSEGVSSRNIRLVLGGESVGNVGERSSYKVVEFRSAALVVEKIQAQVTEEKDEGGIKEVPTEKQGVLNAQTQEYSGLLVQLYPDLEADRPIDIFNKRLSALKVAA
jgi:hypothetical protein